MEYLDLTSDDYNFLYEKLTASKRNGWYILGGSLLLLLIGTTVPMGLIPSRHARHISDPNATMAESSGFNFVFWMILIFGSIFAAVWYFGDHAPLDADYEGGQKVRFKAKLTNLENAPSGSGTNQVIAHLGKNELGVSTVLMPMYGHIRLGDELTLEVTPRKKIVLNVEKL
jgi:hypothetical protein